MKKNKLIKRSLKSQKYTFLIYNLLAYLFIFTILGIVAFISINKIFFRDAEAKIKTYVSYLTENDFESNNPELPNNDRMKVGFYDHEGMIIVELQNYGIRQPIEGKINIKNINRFEPYPVRNLDTWNSHYSHYLTYTIKKEIPRLDISYIKIYMNVDGEVSSRNEIIKVYIICVMTIFILSGLASYLLSRETMKPIVDSLEKQFEFVSDASHELRTPMAIIQSKIENILADPTKSVYEVSEDLAISLKEISRLNRLANDLLTLARNDDQYISLDLNYVNINEIIKIAIEPFEELANLQNKKFTYNGENIIARVDSNKINQIMIILLDNALLYTNEGDSIEITLKQTQSDIIIVVADEGIGISEYTKEHIFDRFYREDKARNRTTGGNGLGLSIAKALIKVHRGKIIVDHNYPKGTKFTITIPKK